ncbi:MAG: hypothetical protein NTX49_10695 [Chlamydiae bacterium]|nr:hypothetical protein [Chlamydiota bacterium]
MTVNQVGNLDPSVNIAVPARPALSLHVPFDLRPIWERVVLDVKISSGEVIRVTDVIHNPTGTLYNDDSLYVVWSKCLILALTSPVFYALKAVWHASRVVLDTTVIASKFF